jgi:protein SCO1/2
MRGRDYLRAARYLVLPVGLAAAAQIYQVRGLVLEVRPAAGEIVVSHREIPGFMGAMVMPFRVRDPRELRGLAPGLLIDFQLEVDRRGSRIRGIRVVRGSPAAEADDLPDLSPPPERVPPGEPMPDFTLTDHLGERFQLASAGGKVVVLTFLYTRCPLPDVCPRLAAHFAYLQRRLAAHLPEDLALLSISLDPVHDTPEVLARYAKIWNVRAPGWRLLTGSEEEVARVARRCGVVFWAEEGQVAHMAETCIIGRDGRLATCVSGTRFTARQLADLVERQLRK